MSGFIYIWYDIKDKRFYIGSHWGTVSDGYICSSTWMKRAYKKRPHDFRRKILSNNIEDRNKLFDLEQKWLNLIKDVELKIKYYNLTKKVQNNWAKDINTRQTVSKKISLTLTGRKCSDEHKLNMSKGRIGLKLKEETKQKIGLANRGSKGKKHTEETKQKMRGKRYSIGPFTQEHKDKLKLSHKGMTGKNHNQDSRNKISQARKGMKFSESHKKNLRKAWLKRKMKE
jgi:hypothetical protein